MSDQPPWYGPVIKALRAAVFFIAHACLAVVIIGLVAVVKAVVSWLGDPKLFGLVPLSWVFDAMDATALVVFIPFGVIEAIRVFKE
jgi:hypothetical protein